MEILLSFCSAYTLRLLPGKHLLVLQSLRKRLLGLLGFSLGRRLPSVAVTFSHVASYILVGDSVWICCAHCYLHCRMKGIATLIHSLTLSVHLCFFSPCLP